jgi:hypothetical protein
MRSVWPATVNGKVYLWKPLLGLEQGLGESAMWLGAARYAFLLATGKSESIAHQEAERMAYQKQYSGLKY